MERLEGGLEKLKSTAAQVDDLKEKLAAQEVELKQKNDDADALIKVVGIEQEKVSPCNQALNTASLRWLKRLYYMILLTQRYVKHRHSLYDIDAILKIIIDSLI